jgi:hypothetical protein
MAKIFKNNWYQYRRVKPPCIPVKSSHKIKSLWTESQGLLSKKYRKDVYILTGFPTRGLETLLKDLLTV